MVNKKGFIRTLEAVIAIVIILVFTYSVMPAPRPLEEGVPLIVRSAQNHILQEVQKDEWRERILETSCSDENNCDYSRISVDGKTLDNFVSENTPPGYDYGVEVCNKPVCLLKTKSVPVDRSSYSNDVFIAGPAQLAGGASQVRLVRIWFWRN